MTWFKTDRGNYIKTEEIICISESDVHEFDKVLHFRDELRQYISIMDFKKLKNLLKIK